MNAAGIILAAGESRRMGRAKALLPFREGTFLSTLADTLHPFCSPVIVVFGFDAAALARHAPPFATSVENPDYLLGMLSSLQTGLRALPADVTADIGAALVALVDHPAVLPTTITALERTEAPIAIPRYGGRRGHPFLIRRELFGELLNAPPSSRIRDVLQSVPARVQYVEVTDPGIIEDVDDPARYESLLAREALR